jgi:asparagine synthase (glutamine-hydrolysing)
MCGIAGILALDGADVHESEVRAMTQSLAHRGPDGEGEYVSGAIGLGHRRLATLDLGASGDQPMSFANRRYWITYNGEIYNFLELRKTLAGLGHTFRSDSDTEVILASFAQWGEECLHRFNGMWAFAIWDTLERRLFLSRDRFGVKPLFYFHSRHYFAFASEMKAFLSLPWFPAAFSLPAVARAIEDPYGLEATSHCLLDGVSRLRAGHSLTVQRGKLIRMNRWWRTAEHLEQPVARFDLQTEEFLVRFTDAVRLRMRSDIPLACTLSGGLDSSSIFITAAQFNDPTTQSMARILAPPKPFVASYPGTSHDESEQACSVARHVGMEAALIEITPESLTEMFDEFVFQCEEVQSPHMGPWLLYRAMSDAGIRVSLDGHGGDELLAGYVDQVSMARDLRLFPLPAARSSLELTALLRGMRGESDATVALADWVSCGKRYAALLRSRISRFQASLSHRPSEGVSQWLRVAPLPDANGYEDTTNETGLAPLTAKLYADFHDRALPTILRDFDRFSMAHGVEVRSPFLDWRLVCYCFSLPSESVLGGGQTKRILREAMRGRLPESTRTRARKIPYKSPIAEWWRGPLRTFVLDTVSSEGFLNAEAWDGRAVRRLVENSISGARFDGALTVLRFVVAHRLMELFSSARVRCAATARQ